MANEDIPEIELIIKVSSSSPLVRLDDRRESHELTMSPNE